MGSLTVVVLGLVGAVVGVGVLLAIVRRPQRGLLALAALSPLNGLLALVPQLPLAGWKEGLLLLTVASAAATAVRRGGPAFRLSVWPWWPAAAALLVVGCVSALATEGSTGVVAIKITFFYLLVPVALWLAPFDGRDRDALVGILMAQGVLTSVVGLAQQVVGAQGLVDLGYTYDDQVRTAGGLLRSFSTFNQPFPFGLYVMTSLLVGGAVALAEPRRWRNALFLVATPVMVVGMGVSIVRASYLGLVLGLVWLGVHRYRRSLVAGVLAVLAVAPVLLLVVPSGLLTPLLSSDSLGQRGSGWSRIISDVLSHPVGLGLGTSGSAAERIAKDAGRAASTTYQPDNYYVKMALELGPVGLWLFVALLVSAIGATVVASQRLRGRDAALALGVSATTVAAGAASLVATYLEIFPLDLYFWLLLGVVGCAVAQHGSGSTPSRSAPAAAGSRPTPVSS